MSACRSLAHLCSEQFAYFAQIANDDAPAREQRPAFVASPSPLRVFRLPGAHLLRFDYAPRAMAPVLATLIILAGLGLFAWIISYRVRPLLFARRDVRWDDPGTRTEKLLLYGFGQKRMPSKPERPA